MEDSDAARNLITLSELERQLDPFVVECSRARNLFVSVVSQLFPL